MTNQKNEFVREKIKDKPLNKKRVIEKLLVSLACGLVFALAFCTVVVLVLPSLLKKRGVDLATGETQAETESDQPYFEEDEPDYAEEEDTTPTDQGTSENPDSLDLEDYQSLMSQLYAVGAGQLSTTVTITSVVEETDWFNQGYDTTGEGLGVVVAETGAEYQILCDSSVISDAKSIQVTFQNDTTASANIKSTDNGTGLSVISVLKSDLTKNTLERIDLASLGSSTNLTRGTLVIALQESGITAGVVTSTSGENIAPDHVYSMISTNISAPTDDPGILLDRNGQIIGIILPQTETKGKCISAVAISQLKNEIALLCEGVQIPYLGLTVSTVTDSIEKEYDLPAGVYVSDVDMDSPAMQAGIQAGDVVTAVNGVDVFTSTAYTSKLLESRVGNTISITVQRLGANGYNEMTYDLTVGVQ